MEITAGKRWSKIDGPQNISKIMLVSKNIPKYHQNIPKITQKCDISIHFRCLGCGLSSAQQVTKKMCAGAAGGRRTIAGLVYQFSRFPWQIFDTLLSFYGKSCVSIKLPSPRWNGLYASRKIHELKRNENRKPWVSNPWKISGDVPANSPILFINPWGKRFRLTERLNARWQHVSHWIEHRPAQLHDDFRNSTWLGNTPRTEGFRWENHRTLGGTIVFEVPSLITAVPVPILWISRLMDDLNVSKWEACKSRCRCRSAEFLSQSPAFGVSYDCWMETEYGTIERNPTWTSRKLIEISLSVRFNLWISLPWNPVAMESVSARASLPLLRPILRIALKVLHYIETWDKTPTVAFVGSMLDFNHDNLTQQQHIMFILYMFIYVYICFYMFMFIYIYVYICICVLNIYIYTYIYNIHIYI